ncbi:nitroreductase family protein [Porticoccaceae bacterium]|nr:nitroreductase family protein [Porticoccaceae bacterium]MDA8651038.1 nitroreductase family protein [Porticoccaceae bacterium]MDA8681001.1 nitroreductase family protein [Porticoccaceae bacterium]MDB2634675.1 nitroreductase family protein [Porticoccaceae bacterium]
MSGDIFPGDEFVFTMANRRSHPRLQDPAPDPELMSRIFAASLRAPDHMHLRPWRFLVIAGDDRNALADLFAQDIVAVEPNATEEVIQGARKKAFRAPLIVVGIARYKSHDKVPFLEQAIATGGVLNNIGMAVYASGFGSVWRTGPYATSTLITRGLGLEENEAVIGYLYIGTPVNPDRPLRPIAEEDFFSVWPLKG